MGEPVHVALSVIIVSYNTAQHLRRCLRSLQQFPAGMAQEVIVIDNASSDGSAEMVAAEFPECRVVRSADNDGYGTAINKAVQHARGHYLMFLNPDTEVAPRALDILVAFAQSHSRLGVVGPRLLLSNGQPQASARRRVSPALLLLETCRLHLSFPAALRERVMLGTYFAQTRTQKVDWISGACHLIPRHVWDRVGPLTEDTFCGFDDYDYCFRAWEHGYEVWLCADATMTHHCSVAVRRRWTSWEVEQVSIHNTYVVLDRHWPAWRIKLLQMAEIVAYASEYVRHSIRRRKEVENVEGDYGRRLKQRILLTWKLMVGRERPIRRVHSV